MDATSKPTKTWRPLDIYTHAQIDKALRKYIETLAEPNGSDAFLRELRLIVDNNTVERAKAVVGAEGVTHENTAINLGMAIFDGIRAYHEYKQNEKLLQQLQGRDPDDGPRILH